MQGVIFIISVSIIFILEVQTIVCIYQMEAYEKELLFFFKYQDHYF